MTNMLAAHANAGVNMWGLFKYHEINDYDS